MNIKVRQNVLPLITAAIWGTAFVAQSVSADKMGGFMFTAARSLIAAVFLAVLIFVCDRTGLKKLSITRPNVGTKKDLIVGGICCGTALFVQQTCNSTELNSLRSARQGLLQLRILFWYLSAQCFSAKNRQSAFGSAF